MGFFDSIKRRFQSKDTPWIDKEDFINEVPEQQVTERLENIENASENTNAMTDRPNVKGKQIVYEYLERDFSPQGYRDAIINADTSYSISNKEIIRKQLQIRIDHAINYYRHRIKDCEFHMKTREQSGLLDLVQEIKSESEKYQNEIVSLGIMLKELNEDKGTGYVVILSYEQGFKRGLAAISSAQIFGKNISDE